MLHNVREDYKSDELTIKNIDSDPIAQFHNWFQDVLKANIEDPNAMLLSSCARSGKPSARVVLLKDYTGDGFTFFTNYASRKGAEMAENPFVSLTFFWKELHRQVRIEGRVEKLPAETSEAYFQSRPRGSQVGAWASPQSHVIKDRKELMDRVEEMRKKHEGEEVLPLPPFWGGYLVVPDRIEFWQGQLSRLHDRFLYQKNEAGEWVVSRLAP